MGTALVIALGVVLAFVLISVHLCGRIRELQTKLEETTKALNEYRDARNQLYWEKHLLQLDVIELHKAQAAKSNPLPLFGTTKTCPKCGENLPKSAISVDTNGKAIYRKCSNCGWVISERPLDAKEG